MQPVTEVTGQNANRTGFIGGSDAPIIMGVSQFKTAQRLYYEKRGELPPEDLSDKEAVQVGSIMEESIAKLYTWKTGRKIRRVNQHQVHNDHPWMRAQIDGKVEGERRHVEIKATNIFAFWNDEWGEEGTDEVPARHLIQMQHQLAVTGYEVADLPVLVNNGLRIYEVPRDEDLIGLIIDREEAFWDCVQRGIVPQLDYTHPTAVDWMQKRYPGTNGQVMDFPAEAQKIAEEYNELGKIEREAKKARAEKKAQLLDLMGECAVGVLPDGCGFTRSMVEESEIRYTRKAYVSFRFTKNPKVD